MTSIIILSYNTREYTQMCIQSIRKYTEPGTYEIIVVDNGSHDGSLNWLLAQPDIRLIANEENTGFPKGCNQGLEIAKGKDLLLLNSDIIVTPRWLDQLKEALYCSPFIGAVSCMTSESPAPQKLEVPYGNDLSQILDFAENYNHVNPQRWHLSFVLKGFCFLFRREVYEKIGGLDEGFGLGNYEDDDYSLRIRKAGWKLLLCEDTFIHHFGNSSFVSSMDEDARAVQIYQYTELLKKNRNYFLKKWDLSDGYQAISFLVERLHFTVNTPKILLLGGSAGATPHAFLRRYPSAKISLVLKRPGDVSAMSPDFPSMYCENIEDLNVSQIKDSYDSIICLEKLDDYHAPQVFLKKISRCLRPQGLVIYMKNERIYSYSSDNTTSQK